MSRGKLAFVYDAHTPAVMALAVDAKEVCDVLWIVDTSQEGVASIARLLRRYGTCLDVAGLSDDETARALTDHHVDGILALADGALEWTAHLAQRLGLTFMTADAAQRLTDKFVQRRALRHAGLAAPGSWVLEPSDASAAFTTVEREAKFPCVLKPRIGAASRDTIPVATFAELRALWDIYTSSGDPLQEFVLEEYIADSPDDPGGVGFAGYVSVESFVCSGRITHLAINGRMPAAPPFRETGFFIPAALDDAWTRAVLNCASQAITAMDIPVGCLHTEIKLTPSGPVIIEVNGRIGGGVPELLAAANGVQFLSLAMRLALGETIEIEEMPTCSRVAYLLYVQAPENIRTVTAVEGLRELAEVAGVDEIVLNRGPGQPVDWREGNHGYVYSVFGTTTDHDELRKLYQRATQDVRIIGR